MRDRAHAELQRAKDLQAKGYELLAEAKVVEAEGWRLVGEAQSQAVREACSGRCGKCRRRAPKWLASSTSQEGERWPVCQVCADQLQAERKPQRIYFESVEALLAMVGR